MKRGLDSTGLGTTVRGRKSKKRSSIPSNFEKTIFCDRLHVEKASRLTDALGPEVLIELQTKACSKWKKASLGQFMTVMTTCHSVDADHAGFLSVMSKFSEWANSKYFN